MALWRDGVSITVEIAFASDPLATTPTWTDVTAYVREVPSVFRGRTDEYGDFAPGTATVILDNRDRRFDPDYAAGAYNPNVVPMKRIKITWAFAAASGVIFTGWVLGWPQQEINPYDGFVTVTAVDGSRFWENSPLSGSAYAAEVLADSPTRYWPLQNDLRDLVVDDLMFLTTYPGLVAGGFAAGSEAFPIGASNYFVGGNPQSGVSSPDGDWGAPTALEFWIDTNQIVDDEWSEVVARGGSSTSLISVQWNSPTGKNVWKVSYDNDDDNVRILTGNEVGISGRGPQHIALRASATVLTLLINGQTALSHTFALPSSTPSPATKVGAAITYGAPGISHIAFYETAPTAARFAAHYEAGILAHVGETSGARIGRILDEIGWPSGLRDIDTGQPGQGPYLPNDQNAIDVIRQVERSEQGLVFTDVNGQIDFIGREALWTAAAVATFSDDGNAGDLVYQDAVRGSHHDTIRNIVTASWRLGGITRRDTTSITAYGEARESIDSVTLNTAELASNLSAYVLRSKKDPATRVESLVAPLRISAGDNEAEKLLALEIGNKVVVERTPVGVSPQVIKTVLVQGIEHTITAAQWTVVLYLSPAPTSSTAGKYLTIGHATLGKVGTEANVVPY